jgi:hypothetical protein
VVESVYSAGRPDALHKADYVESLKGSYAYIIITEANKVHYFSLYFGKELYMFRTDLLSIVRSLNTVFTATAICHTSYDDSLLASSRWNCKSVRNM